MRAVNSDRTTDIVQAMSTNNDGNNQANRVVHRAHTSGCFSQKVLQFWT